MNVAPVCECPKCHMLGLHLMADTRTKVVSRVVDWVTLVEVPTVQWYDQRELKPVTELKTKHELRETRIEKTWVIRECFYCGHQFDQYWKENNELRI